MWKFPDHLLGWCNEVNMPRTYILEKVSIIHCVLISQHLVLLAPPETEGLGGQRRLPGLLGPKANSS